MTDRKQPCEAIVIEILPNIRARLAAIILNEYGLSQTKTAELLGVTQAAISQYTTRRRGSDKTLEDFPEMSKSIHDMAEAVVTGVSDEERSRLLCKLCVMCQTQIFGNRWSFSRPDCGDLRVLNED
ncbi:MAG: transcriptional regulator [Thermoplasmata archaeon]